MGRISKVSGVGGHLQDFVEYLLDGGKRGGEGAVRGDWGICAQKKRLVQVRRERLVQVQG